MAIEPQLLGKLGGQHLLDVRGEVAEGVLQCQLVGHWLGGLVRAAECVGSRPSSALLDVPLLHSRDPGSSHKTAHFAPQARYPVTSCRKPSLIALWFSVSSLPVPPSACSLGTRLREPWQGPERDMACGLGYSGRCCLPPCMFSPPQAEHLCMLQGGFVPLALSLPWAQGGWGSHQAPLPQALPPSTQEEPAGREWGDAWVSGVDTEAMHSTSQPCRTNSFRGRDKELV